MHQRIPTPLTKEQLYGMQDKTLITYCYNNNLLFNISVYPTCSRIDFINAVYKAQFDQIPENFHDIMNNPAYYEREYRTKQEAQELEKHGFFSPSECNIRYYYYCLHCGYVTADQIDRDSEYLDLHCKCGSPMVYDEYADKDVNRIRQNKLESDNYAKYFMVDFYAEERKDIIEKETARYKKLWYYGYK